MDSPIIRFRIDPAIAKDAYRMAAEIGMELPDVLRMFLTRSVRAGTFSLDLDAGASPRQVAEPLATYEVRYWDPLQVALDAELALALLHRTIAELTTSLDEGLALAVPDDLRLARLRDQREAVGRLLTDFDPSNAAEVQDVLTRFGPSVPPAPSGSDA
ncbi:hypothetical protein [Variovorax saccharolyticus]|uniref:hypothetical protein n=1 Tax=Variovorax saccharolyticus TaxID=3053516 RepID=UPI0025750C6D|nr:hypothetical protein [Variovorax sp. J22R187]MDM0022677.1 hypothetical protein [Variovorax sp. J22R187]